MDEFSDLYRVLEMQSVARILEHDDVIVADARQVPVVELGIVQDLPLERVRSVQEQAAALKSWIQIAWKAINVLLILIYRVEINLQWAVRI